MEWVILLSGVLNLFLGLVVWLRSPRKRLNVSFFIFSLSTVVLILLDFLFRFTPTLLVLRSSYAFAVLIPVTALVWILEICNINFRKLSTITRILLFIPAPIFFLLPYLNGSVVENIEEITVLGYRGQLGPLFQFYTFYFLLYILGFIALLYHTQRNINDGVRKSQIRFVLFGVALYSLSAVITSLILPKFFNIFDYTLLDAPSLIFFVGFTAYSILRLHLFNIKVIATELLVFALSIFVLIRIVISENLREQIINGGLFTAIIFIGTFLIRSVINEVSQREKIQLLADELTKANEQQTNLIHVISHQIKGFLTKSRNIFSTVLEGDYGPVTNEQKELFTSGLASSTDGVAVAQQILNAASIERGDVRYEFKPTDLRAMVEDTVEKLKHNANSKGVNLTLSVPPTPLIVPADALHLREVMRNLIDNAIRYTPQGSVEVRLVGEGKSVRFSVKDSGVGISPEDRPRLFTKGGVGKDSRKINVDSSGYGLFIAKQIVEAHKGRIWVESGGEGKGSTFIVELPAV